MGYKFLVSCIGLQLEEFVSDRLIELEVVSVD